MPHLIAFNGNQCTIHKRAAMATAPVTTSWGSFHSGNVIQSHNRQGFPLLNRGYAGAPESAPLPRCAAFRPQSRRNGRFRGLESEAPNPNPALAAPPCHTSLASILIAGGVAGGRPGTRARTGIIAAAAAPAAGAFDLSRSSPLSGGQLDVVQWREGRMLRIWTPPGYNRADAAREPYPVLYLNDGQNLYGDMPTLSGQSWHAAEAAAGLIAGGALPPFVVVGIDHAGAMRSYDYLPYPPGNAGGFRLDADKWPGGGVDAYLRSVVDEILPYTERAYGVLSEPSLRCFGGSSFGGICALCAATRHPGVFGGLLVESPSLWFGEERMLREEMPAFPGPWPARMFLAMGTQEYSGIRTPKQPTFDSHLVALTHRLAALLESRGGLRRGEGLEVEVEEGATHTEAAWAGRLPRALGFLGRHWRAVAAAAAGAGAAGPGQSA
ncbi:hypothetical protein PLESTM_001542400 [Pleodorina starrii]|nr:hypothetical protein PLESTM_001542400 [Pleodorina starrii]